MTRLGHDAYQFSFQEMGSGVFHQCLNHGPGPEGLALQVHQLVLPAATGINAWPAFLRRPFDQYFFGPSHPLLVTAKGAALNHLAQPFETVSRNFGRDEVFYLRRCFCAGAGRKDKCIGAVVLRLGRYFEGALEIALLLAREADDYVRRHGQIRDGRAGRPQSPEIALSRISPVHLRQHTIAPRLEREVEVRAYCVSPAMASMVSGRKSFG